jgi:hypothetical protein
MAKTPDELERKLDAGEWLLPGEVAILLGVNRTTVHWMLAEQDPPAFRYRVRPGRGGYRELHPDDVRRELDARRRVHGASE